MKPETQACVAMFIVLLVITPIVVITHPNQSVVSIIRTEKAYVLQWNGEDTTLTLVTANGNMSISISNGQQFVCNGSTSLYVDNKLIFQVP
jgi:hypothetical protein